MINNNLDWNFVSMSTLVDNSLPYCLFYKLCLTMRQWQVCIISRVQL